MAKMKRPLWRSILFYLWNFSSLSKSMASPWIPKTWNTFFSCSVLFLTMDNLGIRRRSVSFSFRCALLSVWSIKDSRTLFRAWEIDSFLFSFHPLDCSSGADCGVGEYCDRRKYKRDWRNNCRRGFSSAHCLIEFTVDLSLDLRSCYPSV